MAWPKADPDNFFSGVSVLGVCGWVGGWVKPPQDWGGGVRGRISKKRVGGCRSLSDV